MKKINKFICLLLLLIFVSSCSLIPQTENPDTNNTGNKGENNVTNNIIENTTVVGDININDLEDLTITAYEKVKKACVGISFKALVTVDGITFENTVSTGSGVIYKRIDNIDDNGNLTNYTYYLFTNRHVITNNDIETKSSVYVYLGDDYPEYKLDIIGYDSFVDMAVCKFDSVYYIDPVEIANSNEVKRGSFAFAVGCPEGFSFFNSVTFGVISNPLISMSEDTDGDNVKDFNFTYIQHDVAINPGNSGGGLFNLKGELIGLNTLKLASELIDNMGFSIPSNTLKTLAEDYIEKNVPIKRPRLGVTAIEIQDLNPYVIAYNNLKSIPDIYGDVKYGIYITGLDKKGSIGASNVEIDDIVLEINDEKLYNMNSLTAKLNSLVDYKIGDTVKIKYWDRSLGSIVEEMITLK